MKVYAAIISAVLVLMLVSAGVELVARATWTGPLLAFGVILGVSTVIVLLTIDLMRDPR
jgi:hypothetical protein